MGKGPNLMGTTSGNARELDFSLASDNASTDIAFPDGTVGDRESMENASVNTNDTTMLPMEAGTVPDRDTRWD